MLARYLKRQTNRATCYGTVWSACSQGQASRIVMPFGDSRPAEFAAHFTDSCIIYRPVLTDDL
jgi:hypothetical protein